MAKDITAKAIITGRIDASASLGQTVIQYIGESNPYTGEYTVDPDFGVSLGTLSSGYTATLDTTTFAGGFETMLKNALARFPGKKIGYIFVHKCGNFSENHYNIAKQACEKWGIPYCDLNTQAPPLGYISAFAQAYTNNGDGFHPNADGYNAYYVPKITAWMKTL